MISRLMITGFFPLASQAERADLAPEWDTSLDWTHARHTRSAARRKT